MQIAMMADCSDEVMVLARFFDSDNYDKSMITTQLCSFLQKVCLSLNSYMYVNTPASQYVDTSDT